MSITEEKKVVTAAERTEYPVKKTAVGDARWGHLPIEQTWQARLSLLVCQRKCSIVLQTMAY